MKHQMKHQVEHDRQCIIIGSITIIKDRTLYIVLHAEEIKYIVNCIKKNKKIH